MRVRFSFRWQIIFVVFLFAASLLVLLSSLVGAIQLPAREQELRLQLIEVSQRMAEQAAPWLDQNLPAPPREPPLHWRQQLTDIADRVLQTLQGVEGGFYLPGNWNEGYGMFVGHAFPNGPHQPPEPALGKNKGKKKDHPARLPRSPDPPPNEKNPVHDQCVMSLSDDEGIPRVQVGEIGPSRVMIVTTPVGRQRPARMVSWVMTRLTSPEHTKAELVRFQTSAGLALAGMAMALVLMANLGRNLHRERQQRERLGEELRRAEHFAALGRLLAGVAH